MSNEQKNLSELMKEYGIKQKSIAKMAKVSPAAVSLVVNGKSKSGRIEGIIMEEVAKKRQELEKAQ
ncbi:helix-turn-helix domain-containing protein [Desulfovermiculus halophilus]|uniref:helix-turn-helix domain-containing protein n=1 Tax=Desulfovermiculus halophilus TaxID=339722 RepID=UPI000482D37D|nr:helix-turn-helix domain-containing protein [Desulfovermiculus halophilus]